MAGLPEYIRVFTAIEIDEGLRSRLRVAADRLFRGLGRTSLPPAGNLHVTMKFVGDLHRDDLPGLSEAVGDAASLLSPGRIEVVGIGAFPRLARPRVVWAGVSDPAGILDPVFRRLDENLAEFGAKRERKRFLPHVTLARVRGPFDAEALGERIEDGGDWRFGGQSVTAVALVMSELAGGGPPRYTILGHYPPGG
jgi:2'-5' RNA ligase